MVCSLQTRTHDAVTKTLLRNIERKRIARKQGAFEKWKSVREFISDREGKMKKILDHWMHYRFYRLKSTW